MPPELKPRPLRVVDMKKMREEFAVIEARCQVPCDHIPVRSWPLFRARELLHGVIESIQREQTT